MKVNIGPYKSDIIPVYSWEYRYECWRRPQTCYLPEEEYTKFDKFVFGFFDILSKLSRPINYWYADQKRTEKVRIDDYDVWGADHTLALIIHPVLVKLKEKKHGSPCVDDEDVPDHLKSTSASPKENEWDTDDNHYARWDWVLDEMIWAFKQHTDHNCNSDQFHHNSDQLDMTFENDVNDKKTIKFNHQKNPNKPPYWIDEDGKKAHYERIVNGRRLFAKYYDGLWD